MFIRVHTSSYLVVKQYNKMNNEHNSATFKENIAATAAPTKLNRASTTKVHRCTTL